MKKGDISKLELYFIGLNSRFYKNEDYFVKCVASFKSGTKTIKSEYKRIDGEYTLDLNGMRKVYSIEDALSAFKDECQKYETAEILFVERANTVQIDVNQKGVSMKQYDTPFEVKETTTSALSDREYKINIDKASELLKAIGILTKEGKLKNDKTRKYNQIDKFVELVSPMFESEKGEILVLDCACGKSYLSFVLNYYITEVLKKKCKIIGIDYSEQVIKESNKIKTKLNYNNMEFIQADLSVYSPPKKVTAVVSLHACDIATDLAIATGIRANAKHIACVPCCHKELLGQYHISGLESVFKHGILAARLNDVLTDGLRVLKLEAEGYKTNIIEYISPLDTPKNLLIRATKEKDINTKVDKEYNDILKLLDISPKINDFLKDNRHIL